MLDKFQAAAEAVGAIVKRFPTLADAIHHLNELTVGETVSRSHLPDRVKGQLTFATPAKDRDGTLCVSFAQAGIAETGSLFLDLADPEERGATALPVIHAVMVKASTIVSDIYALEERIGDMLSAAVPCYFSITTGPSRTADIERVLTIGVHGPKELHILILEGE
jgi:L-lactate dehydrogenase complex protein LldG